jgi:hypothetical protein
MALLPNLTMFFCQNELFNAAVNILLQRSDDRKYCSDHFSEEELCVHRMHLLYVALKNFPLDYITAISLNLATSPNLMLARFGA